MHEIIKEAIICSQCKKPIIRKSTFTTGYGTNDKGEKICFACCGVNDAELMKTTDKIILYFDGFNVTNWPGTLKIPIPYSRKGRHNIAGVRYDVWFTFAGREWWGVQYGDMTQIIHCKALKTKKAA